MLDEEIVPLPLQEREQFAEMESQNEKKIMVDLYLEMKSGFTSRKIYRQSKHAYKKARDDINEKYGVNIE